MTKPYLFLIFAIYLTTVEKGEGATTLSKLLKASKTDTSQKKSIHNSRYLVRDYGMVIDEQSVFKDLLGWDYFKENMPPWYVFLYHPKYRQVTATERNVKIPNTKRRLSTLFGGKRVFQRVKLVGKNFFIGDEPHNKRMVRIVYGREGKVSKHGVLPKAFYNKDWVKKRADSTTEVSLNTQYKEEKMDNDQGILNDLEEVNFDDYYDYDNDKKIINGRYIDFKEDAHIFRIELYYL